MKILFVSSQLLFEGTRFGGAKRLYNIAQRLESQHDLALICMDGCMEGASFPKSATGFKNILALPTTVKKSWFEKYLWLPIDMRASLKRSRHDLDRFLGDQSFDVIVLAYASALSFLNVFKDVKARKVIYLEDDLFPEAMRLSILKTHNPIRRMVRRVRYFQTLQYYHRILRATTDFVGISLEEIAIMKNHFPWLNTSQIRYGFDVARYELLSSQSSLRIGFIGNYHHIPNADALQYLLTEIWPVLKRELKGIHLVVGGVNIPAGLRSLYVKDENITWMENISELRDFYEAIGIFINPIISGRGMRTKLVEAAAYGRPLISTALGGEGLTEIEILKAESPKEFLGACLKIINDPVWSSGLTLRNRQTVEQLFDIAVVGRQVEALLK